MERSEDCNSSSALCSCGSVHIKNALIYDSDKRSFFKGGINAKDGVITGFDEESDAYDAKGMYIIPGLVDVHTHGRGGFDYNSATLDQMKKMKKLYAEMGVTTVIPTLASAPFGKLIESIDNIKAAGYRGVHIEGRYLNPKKRGAHRLELLSKLDPEEISVLINHAKPLEVHVSAAYELDENGDFLKTIIKLGGTAGLAHTEATVDEALNAVENGVTSFTHLFNAMPPLHHRKSGSGLRGSYFRRIHRAYMRRIPSCTADSQARLQSKGARKGCAYNRFDGGHRMRGRRIQHRRLQGVFKGRQGVYRRGSDCRKHA